MTVTTRNTEDEPSERTATQDPAAGSPQSVSLLNAGVASDKCVVCGAALAPDQHYCVECGTRRGKPRFVLAPAVAASSAPADSQPQGRSATWSSTMALAAVVALLLALGIGLLIGHWTSGTDRVHVTVSGATLGSTSGGSASSSGSTSGGSGSSSTGGGSSKTSGGSSQTVKPGGKCAAGTPGCKNGKETGNFFGS
jgi:hypothetical protein